MKKQLILASTALLVFGVLGSVTTVNAQATTYKTWSGTDSSSGSWTPDAEGTLVTATIGASYFVTIPAALDLPINDDAQAYPDYTTDENNVRVLAGAHVAEDQQVVVRLTAGQTFKVTHQGTQAEQVPYNVKIADHTPIANSNDAGTRTVLVAPAADAHEGVASKINVGFETAPDFIYHGTYAQNVNFTVQVEPIVS
ncbi:MAG: hypothetical protein LBT80_05110 [Lactobacillaceae bacterium]|nr:hypothetical protein [Lactobacillaceae bacterium]